MGGHPHHGPNQ
jgi:hypothetical protein